MKQKGFIFISIFLMLLIMIGLNAAAYVQQEKIPDNESSPNRSSYNSGATGTKAFYDLLAETGRNVSRWKDKPSYLNSGSSEKPDVLIVVGTLRREMSNEDANQMLRWVSGGGNLVVVDRMPSKKLLEANGNWKVSFREGEIPDFITDPNDPKQMTDKVQAALPVLPSVYTKNVNSVLPSRFSSTIDFEYLKEPLPGQATLGTADSSDNEDQAPKLFAKLQQMPPPKAANKDSNRIKVRPAEPLPGGPAMALPTPPPPKAADAGPLKPWEDSPLGFTAPVIHMAQDGKVILMDIPHGSGRIIFLSDPFVVSNVGISLADNLQLAINLVNLRGGKIAFDEYHQGYGTGENRLAAYFAGTPLLAVSSQLLILIGLIMYSRSRRFARALPAGDPNRLSKLEYVSAMAELQRNTRAYDLAIENIYGEFRRGLIRYTGADGSIAEMALAKLASERSGLDNGQLSELMMKCVAIRQGGPARQSEVLSLSRQIREIEAKLGLRRRQNHN